MVLGQYLGYFVWEVDELCIKLMFSFQNNIWRRQQVSDVFICKRETPDKGTTCGFAS